MKFDCSVLLFCESVVCGSHIEIFNNINSKQQQSRLKPTLIKTDRYAHFIWNGFVFRVLLLFFVSFAHLCRCRHTIIGHFGEFYFLFMLMRELRVKECACMLVFDCE